MRLNSWNTSYTLTAHYFSGDDAKRRGAFEDLQAIFLMNNIVLFAINNYKRLGAVCLFANHSMSNLHMHSLDFIVEKTSQGWNVIKDRNGKKQTLTDVQLNQFLIYHKAIL